MTEEPNPTCCAASRTPAEPTPAGPTAVPAGARSTRRQVRVPGGEFRMGDHFDEGYPADGETPVHGVALAPYWMDETTVTNAQFATFVKATGYVTDAERFGTSAVFAPTVAADRADVLGHPPAAPWWAEVRGAHWRRPEGPHSDITQRQQHPVVHASWNDAQAHAQWAGKRLPTEAEWEHASRGGHDGRRFPWGDELLLRGRWLCNVWQGTFPTHNTLEDGHMTTGPAKGFHRNDLGLWSMIGNVWEWCADWFSPTTYAERATGPDGPPVTDPRGPAEGEAKVMRGGSFLCHDSYCYRYRVAARSANTPESSSSNIGFRCANDDA